MGKQAKETQQMFVRDARLALRNQQAHENKALDHTLVEMRERDSTRKDKLAAKRYRAATKNAHTKIKQMQAATDKLVKDSKHQFAEFSDILESSHTTKSKADAKLTDLDAMLIA